MTDAQPSSLPPSSSTSRCSSPSSTVSALPFERGSETVMGAADLADKPELHKKMINAAGKRIRDMNRAAKMK